MSKNIKEMSIKQVERLPSIKDIKYTNVTNPVSDYFEDEILVITKDIKEHLESTSKKKTKLIKTYFHSMPYKEVPKNYKKWWRKDDILKLYKGLMIYGYDLSFLEYYLDYKWSREQIRRRMQVEYKIRPQTVEKAMLYAKAKKD